MGFTGAIFLASFVLFVPIMGLSVIPFRLARWLDAVPKGGIGVPGYLLIACAGYSLIFLGVSFDTLLLWPRQLQRQYLGNIEAGPFQLRSYEHWGFQDPGDEWEFVLDPAAATRLDHVCRYKDTFGGITRCFIATHADKDGSTELWVREHRLHILDASN